jgi:HIRAN domain
METEESIIKVNSGLLAALSSGAININVLPKEILVLECIVAGTSFRELEKIENQLKAQVKLSLKREAKNEYDEFAIALYFEKEKTGYIPKTKNEVIARMMDAGKQFYAVLEAKEWEGNWLRLDIKVYLKD